MQKLRGSGFHFLLQAALHGRSVDRLVQRRVVMRELSNTEEPPPSWRAVAGPVRDSLLTKNEETNHVELMPHKRFHQIDSMIMMIYMSILFILKASFSPY